MKTIAEFQKMAAQMEDAAKRYTKELEDARTEWRMSDYNNDAAYKRYCDAEHELNRAKREFEHYSMLASGQKLFANQHFYTDWEPWEVLEIKTDRCIVVRAMKAELTDESAERLNKSFVPGGFFGHFNNGLQTWTISSDPNGEVATIRRHKNGAFYLPGSSGSGTRFWLDTKPYKYYDYNF